MILVANGKSGDVIVFEAGVHGVLTLDSALPTITSHMEISGPGAAKVSIDGQGLYRIFDIDSGNPAVNSTVTIRGLTITDGYAGRASASAPGVGGGIYSAESLTLENVVISDNSATGDGGGVFIHIPAATGLAKTRVIISNSVITGNKSGGGGGGIFEYGAKSMTMTGTTVSGNSADAGGGGIYAEVNTTSSGLTISRSKVNLNIADYAGGLLLNDASGAATSKVTISDSQITYNQADNGAGGGLELGNSSVSGGHVSITDSAISSNTASQGGGGIFGDNFASLTIARSVLASDDSAGFNKRGGGIYATNGGSITISGTKIMNDNAAGAGGGISVTKGNSGSLTLVSCIVSGNTATDGTAGNGAGVYVQPGGTTERIIVTDGVFDDNTATGSGGAICLNGTGGTFTMTGAKVTGNSAGTGGGGIYAYWGSVTMRDVTVSKNIADGGDGGGLALTTSALIKISNSVISDNTAMSVGGFGGGVFVFTQAGTASILSTSIKDNIAAGTGGGIYITRGSAVTLQQGKVTGNTAPVNPEIYGPYTAFP